MNESLRWKLCLGCLLVVALQAPQVGLLVIEDLAGPYSSHAPHGASARTEPRSSAALVAVAAKPALDAGLFVLGLHDLTVQSAPFSTSNAYLLESGHDFDSDAERAGWFVPGSP